MREVFVTCPECGELAKIGTVDEKVEGIICRDPETLRAEQAKAGAKCRYLERGSHA